jgi:hypothetical protein
MWYVKDMREIYSGMDSLKRDTSVTKPMAVYVLACNVCPHSGWTEEYVHIGYVALNSWCNPVVITWIVCYITTCQGSVVATVTSVVATVTRTQARRQLIR